MKQLTVSHGPPPSGVAYWAERQRIVFIWRGRILFPLPRPLHFLFWRKVRRTSE